MTCTAATVYSVVNRNSVPSGAPLSARGVPVTCTASHGPESDASATVTRCQAQAAPRPLRCMRGPRRREGGVHIEELFHVELAVAVSVSPRCDDGGELCDVGVGQLVLRSGVISDGGGVVLCLSLTVVSAHKAPNGVLVAQR